MFSDSIQTPFPLILVGDSRPIDSSNAQVVEFAGGVIAMETLGEQLELSICLCDEKASKAHRASKTPKTNRFIMAFLKL
jgi:hypothetical protein